MGDAAWAALIAGAFSIVALLVAALLNRRTTGRVNGLSDVVDEWKAIAKEAQTEAAEAKQEAADCNRRLTTMERDLERCEGRSAQLEGEVAGLAQTLQTVLDRFR